MHRAGGEHGDDGLVGRLTTNRASRLLQSLFTRREPIKRKGGVAPSGRRSEPHTHGGALFGVALPWCHVARLPPLRLKHVRQ